MSRKIEIFDLDGTLTDEFHPLWNLITEKLVENADEFNHIALQWQADILTNRYPDKQAAAKDMMEKGVRMFAKHHRNAHAVVTMATTITQGLITKGAVRKEAIDYLQRRIHAGITCIISTGSYAEGAAGFLLGLANAQWLTPESAQQIMISGNHIDWETGDVLHINVDHGKITGLEYALKQPLAEFQEDIIAVFGDDPFINDRALFELGKSAFCIPTSKNSHLNLPANCQRATWQKILSLI